jgi:hypothetical protein
VSAATEDAVVVALARATVERAAPEELLLFPAASEAYLEGREPSHATRGDPMLGFGVETAVVLLTPVALTVAKDVLGFLRAQLNARAAQHGEEAIDWLVDRLLRRGDDDTTGTAGSESANGDTVATVRPIEPLELTDDQLDQVRELAFEKAKQLELPDAKAELLADSLVGSLATT